MDAIEREVILFNEAQQLSREQRGAYLEKACAGDAALRGRVEELLRAEERAGNFLREEAAPGVEPNVAASAGAIRSSESPAETAGSRIGRYKLLQQIGEGGCGVVYMAQQEEPVRRLVALKIIKLGMDTRNVIARFEAERQTLALMDHPNIAKVLEAGATETGRPYFVMDLVRGVKITSYCDQNRLSTRERLQLFIQVCQAIQHAHQQGVIHRDVKPSNILVTRHDDVAVPVVIDFGIAKAAGQQRLTDKTLFTAFEQFIGTPAYMSPEQAEMNQLGVDTRTDIYSLGVLLYELLTGTTPFETKRLVEAGLDEVRRIIREDEPVRPSTRLSTMTNADLTEAATRRQVEPAKLSRLIRGDLDWIVMKALEKDRTRRYATANGLAMDVQRFLANEPVSASPPSNLYRLQKTIRRNKLAFAAAAAVLIALVVGLGLSTWQYVEKSRAEREQESLREKAQQAQADQERMRCEAETRELASRKKAYAAEMTLLQQALAADNLGGAQQLLDRQRPGPGQQDLRGWEWRYFWQFCQSDAAFLLCQRSNSVISVSFSGNGALLAVGTYAGEVTVWDIAARREIFRHEAHGDYAARLTFAPHRDLLAYFDETNGLATVVLWDASSRSEVRHLYTGGDVREMAFTPDGLLFTASVTSSNSITLWDTSNGAVVKQYPGNVPKYDMGDVFAVGGGGQELVHAIGNAPRSVQLMDRAGNTNLTIPAADEIVTGLAFSPAGDVLFTGAGYAEDAIKLWDVTSGRLIGSLEGHRSWVSCLKFLPDGRTLASASADRTIRLWDLTTRQYIRTLHGNNGELWTLDASPDGRWLAGGSKDGSVVFWDLSAVAAPPPAHRTLAAAHVGYWSPLPDGQSFGAVLWGQDRLRVYNLATLQPISEPDNETTNVLTFTYAPDMRLMATTDRQGRLSIWDMPEHHLATNFLLNAGGASVFRDGFVDDGKHLLTWDRNKLVTEWEVATWKEVRHWQLDRDVTPATLDRSENLAAASQGGMIELIALDHPEKRRRFSGEDRISGVSFSPDGKTLAAASENGTAELWDTQTLKRQALLHGVLLGYHAITFSPDGERLAAGSNGQEAIKIWDADSHEEVATLAGEGSFISQVAFSKDGNMVGAHSWNGLLQFWTAPSWKQIKAEEEARRTELAR